MSDQSTQEAVADFNYFCDKCSKLAEELTLIESTTIKIVNGRHIPTDTTKFINASCECGNEWMSPPYKIIIFNDSQ